MPTSTLTSLAILRVTVDRGGDYLEYLRPLVLHVLKGYGADPIKDEAVARAVEEQFGLLVPASTIQLVLKRIARRGGIVRDHGQYKLRGELEAIDLESRRLEAERRIDSVVAGLYDFSQGSPHPLESKAEAASAICAFLAEFDVTCLKAYLQRSTIPDLGNNHSREIILVSYYVRALYLRKDEQFANFVTLMQGHMLANALLCPDLEQLPESFRTVEFYFDTPLLLDLLDLEPTVKYDAARDLVNQLVRLGGSVLTFTHTRDEVVRVIRHAADRLDSVDGSDERGIILESRRRGRTRSDLMLMVEQIDEFLDDAGIEVKSTPRYREEFQIDELALKALLVEEVAHVNPRAEADDINSVRSIYVLRGRLVPTALERSRAVLVTNNTSFARAAWRYGQDVESKLAVSSVITNFTLANTAWLKRPLEFLATPRMHLLAAAYAALVPSEALLTRYMQEIERLQTSGKFSERDLQLLRSSSSAHTELMYFTLGEDAALTEETPAQTLERITAEIRAEDECRLQASEDAHQVTREKLAEGELSYRTIGENVVNRCSRKARRYSMWISLAVSVLLLVGLSSGSWISSDIGPIRWLVSAISALLLAWQGLAIVLPWDVMRANELLRRRILRRMITRETRDLKIDLTDLNLDL